MAPEDEQLPEVGYYARLTEAEQREYFALGIYRAQIKNWVVGPQGPRPIADNPSEQNEVDEKMKRFNELCEKVRQGLQINFEKPFKERFRTPSGEDGIAICYPEKLERVRRRGKEYFLYTVPKQDFPSFGIAYTEKLSPYACVREDLPPMVYEFMKEHEIYHLMDTARWGGRFGMELRANIYAALRKPLCILPTILEGIKSGRFKQYLKSTFTVSL